ncbi:MAG: DUF4838 domain-containing protein, partial [Victivallales bacterium]|nr:DUF4838 domain-containing protein [Victivallales bacterium]
KCPECLKIAKVEGSQMGLMLRFLNPIAATVKRLYPDIIIRTWGEDIAIDNPNRTKPLDNILLWVDDQFTRADCFRPLEHPINDAVRKALLNRAHDGKQFMIWDYWNLGGAYYFNPPRVECNFDAIMPDLNYFRKLGVTDIFIEASLDHASPQNFMPLCYFVADQLLIDINQDAEKLAEVFLNAYFGPCADVMRGCFKEIRKGVAKETQRHVSSGSPCWKFCDSEFMFRSYTVLKATMESLPEGSKYRKRAGHEMISLIWCIIANRGNYDDYFQKHGVEIDNLIDECRKLVDVFMRRYGGKEDDIARRYAKFEERFSALAVQIPVPEQFKGIPRERIRFLSYANFKEKPEYGARIVDDADATLGRAMRGAHPSPDYHGVNKVIVATGKHRFKTTFFSVSGAKLTLSEVPQDEEYHWYKMDGKAVFKPDAESFWTQGWAIHATTTHLYVLTNGNDADNTWDEVWFRAKFTGPAYVPASTKQNAMYIDLVVFTRDKAIGE